MANTHGDPTVTWASTGVTITTSAAVTVQAANTDRRALIVSNAGPSSLYIAVGVTATTALGTRINAGERIEFTPQRGTLHTQSVSAIASTAATDALVLRAS